MDAKLAELRRAWVSGRRVSLSCDRNTGRIEGHVTTVAPNERYVEVSGCRVLAVDILAIHHPSRLGDSTFDEEGRWDGRGFVPWRPQTEQLPNPDGWE